jgi:DNA gyrase subunit A
MATNMPPHNLTEIVDALIMLVNNPQASHDEIMQIIK